jgi:hypothetical protein
MAGLIGMVLAWPAAANQGSELAALTVAAVAPEAVAAAADTKAGFDRTAWTTASIGAIDTRVFDLALGAAGCAVRAGAVEAPSTLTVIDYSKPSTAKRLWVFDLHARKLLYEELVAHGMGTGDNFARHFSNENDSHQTSLGLFVTRDTYVGSNGYSLRLDGLDEGVNDRARDRAIVMHGAPYVSDEFIKTNGRLGRSWGCPALREGVARQLIDRVKGGSLVFSYYPDQDWLSSSKYLGDCAAASY